MPNNYSIFELVVTSCEIINMSKTSENTDWCAVLLENGGRLKGSANYHLELLQMTNVYDKWKKDFYKVHNISTLLENIK